MRSSPRTARDSSLVWARARSRAASAGARLPLSPSPAGVRQTRRGTFLFQDAGTVQDNTVSGDWFVIPGSGTGQLAGLRGEGGFRANLGEGAQVHLDYWFE